MPAPEKFKLPPIPGGRGKKRTKLERAARHRSEETKDRILYLGVVLGVAFAAIGLILLFVGL